MRKTESFKVAPLFYISFLYLLAHSFTTGLFDPIRSILAPNIPPNISLFFIPHGVRVITFCFYGAWGYAYLAPAALLMWILEVYGNGNDFFLLPTGFVSVICTHAAVVIARRPFKTIERQSARPIMWHHVLLAGVIASILNSLCLTLLYAQELDALSFSAYLFGDVTGVIGAALLLLVFLKLSLALKLAPER